MKTKKWLYWFKIASVPLGCACIAAQYMYINLFTDAKSDMVIWKEWAKENYGEEMIRDQRGTRYR